MSARYDQVRTTARHNTPAPPTTTTATSATVTLAPSRYPSRAAAVLEARRLEREVARLRVQLTLAWICCVALGGIALGGWMVAAL
jgi:hypothetical protein